MGIPISQRMDEPEEFYRQMLDNFAMNLRVGIPAIVQSFDPETQTVNVQPALREKVMDEKLEPRWEELPLLLDVPVVIPRAGGFALTLPIQPGDECLIMFTDMCIDAWFSNGDIQNQIEKRRHDLSDAFAILGIWSQPRKLSNYSTTSAQLRSDDGSTYINMANGEIDLVASTVKINGINFATHKHTAPSGGGTTTGPS
ncbi:Gp138 family membrane-puncturing spike protein [Paenibacillus sp. 2RAB27]|uniref:Gp138 family membrane-puncturing spike protein n=1 Tax=Paenibacillus sp. 2RAB27 TaxID=3232991 RepID=UPI003F9DC689